MALKKLVFLFIIFSIFCEANVLDHLKKIENKTDCRTIRNVEFIYLINLDQRPEKYQMCIDQLLPFGIEPYRFSAVYGWDLTLEQINDLGVKYQPGMDGGFMATCYLMEDNFNPRHELISVPGRTYFCHCMARGTIGIVLSHLSVLMDAYESGYETIWVMEDDIEVLSDPSIISNLIDELDQTVGKNNWDILFTDRDIRDAKGKHVPAYGYARRPNFKIQNHSYVNSKISQNLRRIYSRFGATSMIVRRSGMEKLLNFYQQYNVFHPYDMDFHAPKNMKMFTVSKDIITNKTDAISDNGTHTFKEEENE